MLDIKEYVLKTFRETREKNAISLANMAVIKNNKLLELTDEQVLFLTDILPTMHMKFLMQKKIIV